MLSSHAGGCVGNSAPCVDITDLPRLSNGWIQRIQKTSTDIIEACSTGPYLELFARGTRKNWTAWGNQADAYEPTWKTYANHSAAGRKKKAVKGATLFDL
jgi:hypothetical protein